MESQAAQLNEAIEKNSGIISLLSKRGREIYFPKEGILSQTQEAKGKKINATIGEALEDDGMPMRLLPIEENVKLSPDSVFSYAPGTGKPDLRAIWKEMMVEKNPGLQDIATSLPMVTSGLTHGLSLMGYLFVDKDDSIIIPNLYWENYKLLYVNGFEGKIDTIDIFKETGININALNDTLNKGNKGKKILLLNFPNNPSGYTMTKDEARDIVRIIKESADSGNKILVIIDDAYYGLFFEEDIEKESLFSFLANASENILAVKLDGPTKEDYVWGFRLGFITYGTKGGNKDLYNALEMKTAGAIRGTISNCSQIGQSLLLKAYKSPIYKEEKKKKYDAIKSRYLKVKEVLKNDKYKKYFSPMPYNSGYFMCIKLINGINAEEVRKCLLNDFNTGIINLDGLLRIAYSSVNGSLITELFDNIYEACKKISGK